MLISVDWKCPSGGSTAAAWKPGAEGRNDGRGELVTNWQDRGLFGLSGEK